MKKTYNQPTFIVVKLSSRNVMLTASATDSLGMGYGGTTSGNSINEADVKTTSDVNLWDNEW